MIYEFNFKLILNRKEYLIPSNFPFLDDVDAQIHTILKTKGQYIVKSNVSKVTFQTFLDNWVNNSSLNIRNDNIEDFILLSQEFDRIKAEISLFKKMSHSHNSHMENKNQTLNKKFEKRLYNLKNKDRKFHLIIDHLFNNVGIDSHSRFLEIRTDLYDACMKEKVSLINLFTQKEIRTKSGFSFIINEGAKTAGIFRTYLAKDNYFIPRTVHYNNDDYIITIINQYAFKNTHAKTIKFDENSEIQIIEKHAFYKTNIRSIKLPKHVKYIGKYAFKKCYELCSVDFSEESELEVIESNAFCSPCLSHISLPSKILQLKKGWCSDIPSINNIIVSPNKEGIENIMLYNDTFLIGKSNPEINVFDYLILAKRDIETADIPAFIRIIGPYAFASCNSLEYVKFPENSELEIIEQGAFSKSSLVYISIPKKVTKIGDNCFSECKKLESISFSIFSKLKSIGKHAFLFSPIRKIDDGLGSLKFDRILNSIKTQFPSFNNDYGSNILPTYNQVTTKISIPSSVSHFDKDWCCNTPNIKDIQIVPNEIIGNIELIDEKIMIGKSDLSSYDYDVLLFASRDIENVVIPSYIKRIARYAFADCKSIQKVEFSENSQLEVIEKFAFSGASIESITIPPTVIEIEDFAFYNCGRLSEVNFSLNSDLKIIGNYVFYKTLIDKITISSNVEKIKENFFYEINWLTSISVSPNNRFYQFLDDSFLVSKSDSLSDIYDVLVFAKRNIKTAVIPSFIKIISSHAFEKCNQLESVTFSHDSELVLIGEKAFNFSSITEILIPSHVKRIGKLAFNRCYRLNSVKFEENSELESIGDHAFNSTLIDSITIPKNVYQIGQYSFSFCRNLENFEICSNTKLRRICPFTFESSSIQKISIPSSITRIEKYAFYNCLGLLSVEFTDDSNLSFIGKYAFSSSSIESIKIPQHVSQISEKTFYRCFNLKTVEFSENSELKVICNDAFCDSLVISMSIPSTVFAIGSCAFGNCKKLQTVDFSEDSNIQYISKSPFQFSSIENLSIPDNLDMINNYFFSGTPKLINVNLFSIKSSSSDQDDNKNIWYENQFIISKSFPDKNFNIFLFAKRDIKEIKIPPFIKVISYNAFENCKKLKSVDFSESKVQLICDNSFLNSSIKSITIPDETKRICMYSFSICDSLETVEFSTNSKLCIIDDYAFYSSEIKSISIPAKVKMLGSNSFAKCRSLERVIFQEDSELIKISYECFKKSGIRSISIPKNVTVIESNAFYNCYDLQIIEINDNTKLTQIDTSVFNNHCLNTLVMAPSTVKFMEPQFFM